MNVKKYFNQEVIYKKYIGKTGTGTIKYDNPIKIKVRLDLEFKSIISLTGTIVTVSGIAMYDKSMNQNDIIIYNNNEYKVYKVCPNAGKDSSKIVYYDIYVI